MASPSFEAYADKIYADTKLKDAEFAASLFKKSSTEIEALDDPFLKMWKNQGPQTVQKINEMYPDFDLPDDYFQTTHPADYSAFLYDAILSIGMG